MIDLKPVLSWVNQEREKRGMEPLERLPKGRRRQARVCPVAKAIRAPVHKRYFGEPPYFRSSTGTQPLPPDVRDFIRDFDNGKYPELVA